MERDEAAVYGAGQEDGSAEVTDKDMAIVGTLIAKLVGDIGPFVSSMKQAENASKGIGGRIAAGMNGALGTIGNVAKIAGTAAVAGIGAATGAAIAGVTAFNSWAGELDSLGDVLGTTADESAGMAVAIRTVGGDVQGITGQMAKLVKGLGEAGGKATPTAKELKALGVSAWEANGNLKSSTDILTDVADRLAKLPDGLEKTRIMTQLFGKSGKDLSDTMNALANGGLAAAEEKARALGLAIGEDGVNKSIEMGKGIETLKLALEGMAVSIGSVLMPVIVPAIQKFAEWAVQVMPQLRQGIDTAFTWISTNVGPIIGALVAGLQTAVTWVQTNWPIISAEITGAFERARAALDPIISGLSTFITSIFGAIATYVSTHGEDIKWFLSNAWETIRGIVEGVVNVIGTIVQGTFGWLGTFINENQQGIQTVIDVVWGTIRSIIEIALGLIRSLIDTALGLLRTDWGAKWNEVKNIVNNAWNTITTMWNNFWNGVQTILNNMGSAVQAAWTGFWGGIRATVENIWNGIKLFIQNAVNGVIDVINGMIEGFNNSLGQITGALALIPHVNLFASGQAAGASYVDGVQTSMADVTANVKGIVTGGSAAERSAAQEPVQVVVYANVANDIDLEMLAMRVAREIRVRG